MLCKNVTHTHNITHVWYVYVHVTCVLAHVQFSYTCHAWHSPLQNISASYSSSAHLARVSLYRQFFCCCCCFACNFVLWSLFRTYFFPSIARAEFSSPSVCLPAFLWCRKCLFPHLFTRQRAPSLSLSVPHTNDPSEQHAPSLSLSLYSMCVHHPSHSLARLCVYMVLSARHFLLLIWTNKLTRNSIQTEWCQQKWILSHRSFFCYCIDIYIYIHIHFIGVL